MKTYKYSANTFNNLYDLQFCPDEYSKFKHGSKTISRKFGKELGEDFVNEVCDVNEDLYNELKGKDIVVCSAPYKYIPVASTGLKDYFVSVFNKYWAIDNNPVIDLKVFRGHSYNDDYGSMTQEQRNKSITSDDFYIDREIIKDKVLFFIDDIRITGSHERRIESLLESVGFDGTVVFLYYASLKESSDVHPNIENELNYHFVKNILDIDYIIKNEEFIFNTRATKYILKQEKSIFKTFVDYQSEVFRETLLSYTMGNGYHKLEDFRENIQYLINILNK